MKLNNGLVNKFILQFILLFVASLSFIFSQDSFGSNINNNNPNVFINDDGSLILEITNNHSAAKASKIEYLFSMPPTTARKKWVAENKIYNLEWEDGGIKYTMSVFLNTKTFNTDFSLTVLFVKLHGENTDSEYREAKAGFSVKVDENNQRIVLKEGFVLLKDDIIAHIDIPAGCTVEQKEGRLKFSGNMPPGTTGAMVFKIPVNPLHKDNEKRWLSNLEYEEEMERLRRTDFSSDSSQKKFLESINWSEK